MGENIYREKLEKGRNDSRNDSHRRRGLSKTKMETPGHGTIRIYSKNLNIPNKWPPPYTGVNQKKT